MLGAAVWLLPCRTVRSYEPSPATNGTSVSQFRETSRASPPHPTGCCCRTGQGGDGPLGCPPATAPMQLCQSHVFAFACSPDTGAEFLIKQTLIGYCKDANRWHKASSTADVKSCHNKPGSAFPLQRGWMDGVAQGYATQPCQRHCTFPLMQAAVPVSQGASLEARQRVSFNK